MNAMLDHLASDDLALRLPLTGVQQVEASAGTGKTFTIAGLYARLVVERKLELRNILVMTFTRAATEELRARLRRRLLLCAELAASPEIDTPPGDDLEPEHAWAWLLLRRALDAGESQDALAHRLRLAVLGMDEAVIVTIHGFCQRVLREHATLVDGASRDAELEPDDGDLLEEFAADAWLRIADDDDVLMREALPAIADTPAALAKTLKGLVAFAGDIEPPAPAAPLPVAPATDRCRDAAFDAWAKSGAEAVAVFEKAHADGHFTKAYRTGSVPQLHDLAWHLRARRCPGNKWLQKFATSQINAGMMKKAQPFAGHPAFDALETWWQAERARADAVRARIPPLLHRLVDDARVWLARRKRALARLSYDDQIGLVHAGLGGGAPGQALLGALRTQYPVALVDEFQDTDARQFEIFERLYGAFGTLYCIGDPKQAIYGFRGGDVHAYLRARKLANACWPLTRNFRCSPGMLDAHAALFGQRDDVFVERGIAFEAVQWGGAEPPDALRHDGDPVAPMTLWQLPDTPIKGGKEAVCDWMADVCAAEVARLLAPGATTLDGEPLRPKAIAVLVNSNDEAMRIQDALAARGVPAVCLRRESIFASNEAGELRRILDALLDPRHARLARGALATHLLGRQLDDLKDTQGDDIDWRDELDDLRARWFERGILAMLERLGEQHAQRLLQQPGGERCLSNLMQLGDALQAEARRLATPHAQRDWLVERIALADENNEHEQLRLESDAERVQILTLHASKGLEYDLVFLPFAALMYAREPRDGTLARFHRGDRLVKRYLGSGTDVPDDAVTETDTGAKAIALEEDLAEGVRKLYVGVTRARHACWLSCGKPSTQFKNGVLDWVLPDGADALRQQAPEGIAWRDVPAASDVPTAVVPADVVPACRTFERPLDRDWWVHSFSRLSDGRHVVAAAPDAPVDASDDAAAAMPAVSAGPRGARFGSAIHEALERADFAAWAGAPDALPAAQRQMVVDVLQSEGFATEVARDAAMRMLGAALRTPLFEGVSLATLPASQRRAEMEFHFGIAGADPQALLRLLHDHGYQRHRQVFAHVRTRLAGLMNGLIDLTFVHGGRWWVVDYKTNHLGDHAGDYAPARLPAAIAAHDYDLQYLIYTVALHRWLRQVRGADYDYQRDFGGVCYLFARGMGVGGPDNGIFRDRPPAELVEAMDDLLQAPGAAA